MTLNTVKKKNEHNNIYVLSPYSGSFLYVKLEYAE